MDNRVMSKTLRTYIRGILREEYQSHTFEPKLGDPVVNTNINCKHYGSEGVVKDISDLDGDAGKVIVYIVTNDGAEYSIGDVLEKTMDQLAPLDDMHEARRRRNKESMMKITETHLRKIIHQVLLVERKTIATVSDVTKFKPQIEEWVEILIDELVDAVPRMEAMDEKRRNSVIDGLTGKVVSALIDVTSSMTDYDRSNQKKEKFKKEYEKERLKRSSGGGPYYGEWRGFS